MFKHLLLASIVTFAVGCDGGGSGGETLPPSTSVLTGIVASGAPLAGAIILVKDRVGNVSTATSAANGSFSVSTAGMTPPVLIRAVGSGRTLFSASPDGSGNVNVHPLSNSIVQTYYQGQNLDPNTVINSAGSPAALPSKAELNNLQSIVQNDLQPVLRAAGLDVSSFDILKTAFVANGAGLDKLLDNTTIGANGLDLSSTVSGVTVALKVNLDANGDGTRGDVQVAATTTNSAGNFSQTSSDVQITPASQQSDSEAAISGVEDLLRRVIARINAKRGAAQATDFTEFFDDQFQGDGQNRTQKTADFVEFTNQPGPTLAFLELVNIEKFAADTSSGNRRNQLFTRFKIRSTPATGSPLDQIIGSRDDFDSEGFRRQTDGSWRFFGNQDVFRISVRQGFLKERTTPIGRRFDVHTNGVPQNTVNSVTVSGPANSLPTVEPSCSDPPAKPLNQASVGLFKTPRTDSGVAEDLFALRGCFADGEAVTAYAPAGTEYTFSFARASGGTVVQKAKAHGFTDETFSVTSLQDEAGGSRLNGGSCSAVAGKKLTATWTRPNTLSVRGVELSAFAFTNIGTPNQQSANNADQPNLDPLALTGSVTIPGLVNGQPPTTCGLEVTYTAQDGARTTVRFVF